MKNNRIFYGWVNLLIIWIVALVCVVPFCYSFDLAVGALGFLALALLNGESTVLYYVIWMVPISIFLRFGGSYCSQMCISKWFYCHRGLAMSIFFVAGGVGGYLFTPFLKKSIRCTAGDLYGVTSLRPVC